MSAILAELRRAVGKRHLVVSQSATLRYRTGFRSGSGDAVAVIRPATLCELWRVLKVLVPHDVAIIMQAANTGLTGGSTPDSRIGQPVFIINTMRMSTIHPILDGEQMVCLAGSTLFELERIASRFDREPHSIIGSSCFGASVVGGVCNNSGGALVRRGPAYTQCSLFAHITAQGELRLVNNLGMDLGSEPLEMLDRLTHGDFSASRSARPASAQGYEARLRAIDADTPARYNADPACLHDASGSAGRLIVFAVLVDTFEKPKQPTTYYIGTNDPQRLEDLRRNILSSPQALPLYAEYLHQDAFRMAEKYGRDTMLALLMLGTSRLSCLYRLKSKIDQLGSRFGLHDMSEQVLQWLGRLVPFRLPRRLLQWRDRFEHHLILKVEQQDAQATQEILNETLAVSGGDFFVCNKNEAEKALLHRFIVAGAAIRCRAVQKKTVGGMISLDVALPRNSKQWSASLPEDLTSQIVAQVHYGHFFCHVFHRDYLVAHGANCAELKQRLLELVDHQGGKYPAEHNVGRQYRAEPALEAFYRSLDPTNRLNPGIGMTTTRPNWNEAQQLEFD